MVLHRTGTDPSRKNVTIPTATTKTHHQGAGAGVGVADTKYDIGAMIQRNQTRRIAVCITDMVLYCSMCGPLAIVDRAGDTCSCHACMQETTSSNCLRHPKTP